MVFKSTICAVSNDIQRRPLTRTRFRCVPRPRRFSVAVPLPGLLENDVVPGTTCGSELTTFSTLTVPESENSSASTTAIGAAVSTLRRAIREPVTMMASPSLSSAASAAALAASCACAGAAIMAPAMNVPVSNEALLKRLDIPIPLKSALHRGERINVTSSGQFPNSPPLGERQGELQSAYPQLN